MTTTSATPASAASMMASAANGGGTKMAEAFAFVASAAARRDAGHDVGAVVQHLLGVEAAGRAGDALDEDARLLVDEDAHGSPS
jgi:hypothetical protein